jgi:hypothetical protein
MADQEELEAERDIREQFIGRLRSKSEVLYTLIHQLGARNDSLKATSYAAVESRPPIRPARPSADLLTRYFDTHQEILALREKYDNLLNADRLLDRRIESASRLLEKQTSDKAARAIRLLSPTAAAHLDVPESRPSIARPFVELSMFENQLNAIAELKRGVVAKPSGKLSVNLDQEIERITARLRMSNRLCEQLTEDLAGAIKRLYAEAPRGGRREFRGAYSNFLNAYHRATFSIDRFSEEQLFEMRRTTAAARERERAFQVLSDLNEERELLLEQLAARGGNDEEMMELRGEVEFALLHLSHLTAVAGKGLARISTEKEPIDPIDSMQAEIAELELHALETS